MKTKIFLLGIVLIVFAFGNNLSAQTYTLQQGPPISTCGGTILDPGGAGDYVANLNVTQTFCSSTPGECIQLTFTSFVLEGNNYDKVILYDGPTISDPVIGSFTGAVIPPTLSSTANSGGCITVQFISDVSNQFSGFSAEIACIPCPPTPLEINLGNNPVISTCSANIYDPGGNANYQNNQNVTQTLCSSDGTCLELAFLEFNTDLNSDFVRVYDGTGTAGLALGEFSGSVLPPVLTSTTNSGGCLTLRFTSDNNNNQSGFKAKLRCVPCPVPPIIMAPGTTTLTSCDAVVLDPGGFLNYPANSTSVQTFCSGNGDCVNLDFTSFETEAGSDFVRIYDGSTTADFLIAEYSGFGSIPAAVTSSTNSGGCLTVAFTSNASNQFAGFQANLSCVPCVAPSNVVIFGQTPSISTCGVTVLDPGGNGAYPPNSTSTQTFCSNDGTCIQLLLTDMDTEADLDILRFYDGNSTAAEFMGQASGQAIPPAFTSSTNSGGCLTVTFTTNATGYNSGFSGSVSCLPCPPPPQNIIMGQGPATVNTCGGSVLDPGGNGNYGDNLSVTQTICSGTAQCLSLTFSSFQTENAFDRLSIYDGLLITSASHLGTFSGTPNPMPVITSSTESGGCLTLVFSSNSSVNNIGFSAVISCAQCEELNPVPTGNCEDARPFCTEDVAGITYPAATNTTSPFLQPNGGSGVGCLGSTPNPAWYYMRVEQSGSIIMDLVGSSSDPTTPTNDIDYILWGPFASQEEICGNVTNITWANDQTHIVSCSYSASATETASIPNALAGEYYVILVTNYSNTPTNIYITPDPSSTGQTDCSIFCEVDLAAILGTCDPATNTYTVSGQIQFSNPPETGTATVINSSGGFDLLNAPFPDTYPFSFNTLSSDGTANDVSVFFSDNGACAGIYTYTAPASCSSCPVTATVSGPACIGQDVSLFATVVANATYSWIGPNGFTSNLQNPQLTNVTSAMSGVYTVTVNNPLNSCQALASTNVYVYPTPATAVISSNAPICAGLDLTLFSDFAPNSTYAWTGPNGFTSTLQNPVITPATDTSSGDYICIITSNTCPSLPATLPVVVYAIPETPAPLNNSPLCVGDNLQLTATDIVGATYEWKDPAGTIFSAISNPVINSATVSQSGTYSVRVKVNDCWSLVGTTEVSIFAYPAAPAIVANPTVCMGSILQLNGPTPTVGAGTVYTWTGPNAFSSAVQSPSIADSQIENEGVYTLTITDHGCVSPETTVAIDVIPLPIPNAGADVVTCSNVGVQVGASAIPGYTYQWTDGQLLNFPTASDPIVTSQNVSLEPIIKQFILTATESGCSAKDTVLVLVNPQPIAYFKVPDPQCFRDNKFEFYAEGTFTDQAVYDWNFGPLATPSASLLRSQPDVHFNSTGMVSVVLQVTDRGCVSSLYQMPVMVYKMPVANMTSDRFEACAPELVKFQSLAESDNKIKRFQWTLGNENVSEQENPVLLYSKPGNYDISFSVTNSNNCVDTYTIPGMIRIYPTPVAQFGMDPLSLTLASPTTHISDLSVGGTSIYYNIPGVDTIYQKNPRITFQDSGHYFITQVVSNTFGCVDSFTREIIYQYGYKLYIPTAFTPNGDGYNDFFKVYGEDLSSMSMMIYNRWGELMYTSYDIDNGWDGRIKLQNDIAAGGLYIYKISTIDRNGLKANYQGTVMLLR